MRGWTVTLTIPVIVLLLQPLWAPQWGSGILGEVSTTGPVAALAAAAVFFALVALYCRTLQQILICLPEWGRVRSPRSVWWMFALPFNFVEDFFIVNDIAGSLAVTSVISGTGRSTWRTTGLTWCALQIMSLLPGPVGLVGGVLAIPVWLGNWAHAGVILRRLARAALAGDQR
ncbi:hypothetical protein HNP40_001521 [Mycobacteroides chelonae]|nr:hypothetical protein [Mycobacteroides chelonae]